MFLFGELLDALATLQTLQGQHPDLAFPPLDVNHEDRAGRRAKLAEIKADGQALFPQGQCALRGCQRRVPPA